MSLPSCPASPNTFPCEALTENTYSLEGNVTYRVTMPATFTYTDATGTHTLKFDHWTDDPANTNPTRDFLLDADLTLNAEYIEQPIVAVGGTVSDPSDTPIPNASVTFKLGDTTYPTAITDNFGFYNINLPTGNGYTMTVSHPSFQTYNSPPFNITEPTSTLNVVLSPPTPQSPAWLVALPIMGGVIYWLWKT